MANPGITITVVVSGQGVQVSVNPNQKVAQLIKEALHVSGNKGQSGEDWELRTANGNLLDPDSKVADAAITEGITLYLSPKAGAGGE